MTSWVVVCLAGISRINCVQVAVRLSHSLSLFPSFSFISFLSAFLYMDTRGFRTTKWTGARFSCNRVVLKWAYNLRTGSFPSNFLSLSPFQSWPLSFCLQFRTWNPLPLFVIFTLFLWILYFVFHYCQRKKKKKPITFLNQHRPRPRNRHLKTPGAIDPVATRKPRRSTSTDNLILFIHS